MMMLQRFKRKVNINFDSKPSLGHIFNFNFSKEYIKDKVVLDVGCWTGQYEQLAATYVKEIFGIDSDKEAIKYAQTSNIKCKFIACKAQKLPFRDGTFDVVLLLDVLEHLPLNSENKALSEVYRVLKPNGILILSTPNKNILSILFDPAFFILGHRHYSLSKIKHLLKGSNFSLKNERILNGIVVSLYSNVCLLSKYLFGKNLYLPQFLQKTILNYYCRPGYSEIYIVAQSQKSF